MKRILLFASVSTLLACASTRPPEPKALPANNSPVAIEEPHSRSVAAAGGEEYSGQPGNFTYQYHGTLKDFDKIMFSWHPIGPTPDLGFLLRLSSERTAELNKNLFDTGVDDGSGVDCATLMRVPHRTANGQCYFFNQKVFADQMRVGDNQQRFGRNMDPATVNGYGNPYHKTYDIMDPNPREISRRLFTRREGKTREADILNLLAAAWLQAENHDWFTHGKNVPPSVTTPIHIPAVSGDADFPQGIDMPVTKPDTSGAGDPNGYIVTFRNNVTHWWDASHIYGSDEATIKKVRTNPLTGQIYPGGLIAVDEQARHLYYENGLPITGFNDNWWVGLELIHSLFAMEHNSIARALRAKYPIRKYPQMDDETIFQKTRLIVAALIAKIHTVEWTPALLDNKVLHVGMYSNWHGLRSTLNINAPYLRPILGDISEEFRQAVSGLVGPGTGLDLYNVPFTLTEEFVAVYRMHPLVPEQITPRNVDDWTPAGRVLGIGDVAYRKVEGLFPKENPLASLQMMYGFGTGHPGGLVLHNYPTFLQNIHAERNTGVSSDDSNTSHFDMGAIDILRDRERHVPRYNDFRRGLRLKPLATFADLTDDPDDIKELNDIYGGDVEKLDLIVGTLAEKDRYAGFAFGNTPFYIFALMASRRLMADPFFHEYYVPAVYTQLGLDWIDKTTMIDVIKRHYPELDKAHRFDGVINAFKPWQPVYNEVAKKYNPGK